MTCCEEKLADFEQRHGDGVSRQEGKDGQGWNDEFGLNKRVRDYGIYGKGVDSHARCLR